MECWFKIIDPFYWNDITKVSGIILNVHILVKELSTSDAINNSRKNGQYSICWNLNEFELRLIMFVGKLNILEKLFVSKIVDQILTNIKDRMDGVFQQISWSIGALISKCKISLSIFKFLIAGSLLSADLFMLSSYAACRYSRKKYEELKF